jgi:hypothetical protein
MEIISFFSPKVWNTEKSDISVDIEIKPEA